MTKAMTKTSATSLGSPRILQPSTGTLMLRPRFDKDNDKDNDKGNDKDNDKGYYSKLL